MRSVRPRLKPARPTALAATALAAVLALTMSGCNGSDEADAKPSASAQEEGSGNGIPDNLADRLKERGIDPDKWKDGGWKDWDKEQWLREAKDFVNPVIKDLWDPARMQKAKDPGTTVSSKSDYGDGGYEDPTPTPQPAKEVDTPYHKNAAPVGKIFFDSPEGQMVCSGTVVKDPRNPGKSNLVWTAGHCVHAGAQGGWYRNLIFVPSYNDLGMSDANLRNAQPHEVAPYGRYWADWVSTSGEWINDGAGQDSKAFAHDYAVMHVKPENGGPSLEETVGAALDVDFTAPEPREIGKMGAWGYPAAPPFDGLKMHSCLDRPGGVSVGASLPTMFRIGCTMTGGSSGGGWFYVAPDGKTKLVSNTSMGPADNTWLAGPQLGQGAEQLYDMMSEKYGAS